MKQPTAITAYLALGSNLGDRMSFINQAYHHLNEFGIKIISQSSVIETDPIGGPDQGLFLNAVVEVQTKLSPRQLLDCIHKIEQKLGRVRTIANGPRTIDIDILIYDGRQMNEPDLVIPHPRMFERDFVMIPLMEINPELVTRLKSHDCS